jgi:hypothetical protein
MDKVIAGADYCGMTASVICLVHCIGTPLLLLLFPMLGLAEGNDSLHRTMAILVVIPALFAILPGFRKHRNWSVPLTGSVGLICFITSVLFIGPHYGEMAELLLATIGGVLLFTTHYRNHRFCRCCIKGVGR